MANHLQARNATIPRLLLPNVPHGTGAHFRCCCCCCSCCCCLASVKELSSRFRPRPFAVVPVAIGRLWNRGKAVRFQSLSLPLNSIDDDWFGLLWRRGHKPQSRTKPRIHLRRRRRRHRAVLASFRLGSLQRQCLNLAISSVAAVPKCFRTGRNVYSSRMERKLVHGFSLVERYLEFLDPRDRSRHKRTREF
jgi:hypothetical protein